MLFALWLFCLGILALVLSAGIAVVGCGIGGFMLVERSKSPGQFCVPIALHVLAWVVPPVLIALSW